MTVVSDSSPIIALARVNKLHLFENLFGQVVIPDGVYKEIAIEGRPGAKEVSLGRIFKRETVKNPSAVLPIRERLGQADAEVIILAKEKKADVILTNDRQLIKQAEAEKIPTITVLDILLQAQKKGFLDRVQAVMDEMQRQGVGIDEETYEETLKLAGEK
ncbi:DUF3368 domain-containing protein [Candidatus Poribacteria bacterium]|nr:DUF3368 domain-containing protein [Candidatus Poribacteria bacterium]